MRDTLVRLDPPLDRDRFLVQLLGHFSNTLEDIVGLEEASGFFSVVGHKIGTEVERAYRAALGGERLDPGQFAEVMVDLTRRLGGDFFVIEQSDERLVLGGRRCPFGEGIVGHTSLCMMTSSVFGRFAAENTGYGKVDVERAIAAGDPQCRVVVYLHRSPEAAEAPGREYFGDPP
ncbi:MAG: transcriptional regulator [Acidobacteria bacterium]|nr:transcriptional regulator [Acidobacteriota bacterium]